MSFGSPSPPPLRPAPKPIDAAAEKAKIELKARQDSVAAMREQAKRRGQASTLLAGGYDASAKLGTSTLLGS